jgi:hypothetical protein
VAGQTGFKRKQERSLQSDTFNLQQDVAIKGIARSTFCVLHDTMHLPGKGRGTPFEIIT